MPHRPDRPGHRRRRDRPWRRPHPAWPRRRLRRCRRLPHGRRRALSPAPAGAATAPGALAAAGATGFSVAAEAARPGTGRVGQELAAGDGQRSRVVDGAARCGSAGPALGARAPRGAGRVDAGRAALGARTACENQCVAVAAGAAGTGQAGAASLAAGAATPAGPARPAGCLVALEAVVGEDQGARVGDCATLGRTAGTTGAACSAGAGRRPVARGAAGPARLAFLGGGVDTAATHAAAPAVAPDAACAAGPAKAPAPAAGPVRLERVVAERHLPAGDQDGTAPGQSAGLAGGTRGSGARGDAIGPGTAGHGGVEAAASPVRSVRTRRSREPVASLSPRLSGREPVLQRHPVDRECAAGDLEQAQPATAVENNLVTIGFQVDGQRPGDRQRLGEYQAGTVHAELDHAALAHRARQLRVAAGGDGGYGRVADRWAGPGGWGGPGRWSGAECDNGPGHCGAASGRSHHQYRYGYGHRGPEDHPPYRARWRTHHSDHAPMVSSRAAAGDK